MGNLILTVEKQIPFLLSRKVLILYLVSSRIRQKLLVSTRLQPKQLIVVSSKSLLNEKGEPPVEKPREVFQLCPATEIHIWGNRLFLFQLLENQ